MNAWSIAAVPFLLFGVLGATYATSPTTRFINCLTIIMTAATISGIEGFFK